MNATIMAIFTIFLIGCTHPKSITRIGEANGMSFRMADMLLELPAKYWESTPNSEMFAEMFPKGVPEDFVTISTGGAQNDFDVMRLNGSSIAIAVGNGERPDYAETINARGRNLEILRRGVDGWEDITSKALLRHIQPGEYAKLHPDGRLVISDTGGTAVATLRYDGTAFKTKAQQSAVE